MENVSNSIVSSATQSNDIQKQKLQTALQHLGQHIKNDAHKELHDGFNEHVQKTFIKAIREKKAPWLTAHDGTNLAPYNPVTGQQYQKFNRLWLEVNQALIGSSDPRWISAGYLYENNLLLKKDAKPTTISYANKTKDGSYATSYVKMYNGEQIVNMPTLQVKSEILSQPVKTYHPESLHPKDTLRADIVNYVNAQDAHAPFEPKGTGRTEQVASFLEKSKSGTIFYIVRDAQVTADKMLTARMEKTASKSREQPEFEMN